MTVTTDKDVKTERIYEMSELREALAEIVMDMPDYPSGDDQSHALSLADRILALPEIAEALRLRNVVLASQMPDLPPERVGELIRGMSPPA